MQMYLLKKLGMPLIAILILSILALITVVLIYENNGLQLPTFDRPQTEPYETEAPLETEAVTFEFENYYSILSGGYLNE